MKKILILVAIFVGVVGLVIGSLFLMGGGEDISHPAPENVVSRYQQKINKYWEKGEWSPECYDNARAYLYSGRKKLGGSFITLLEYNDSRAVGILDTAMVAEWAKSNCDPTKINLFYEGLTKVKKESKIEGGAGVEKSDSRVSRLDGTYKLYRDLCSFCSSNFGLAVKYPDNTSMAARLRTHHTSILERKSSLKGSDYYKYLADITAIKDGLAGTESRLAKAEKAYFESMVGAAESYYRKMESITSEQYEQMKAEIEGFKRQVSEAAELLKGWMRSEEASLNSIRNKFNNKTANELIAYLRSIINRNDEGTKAPKAKKGLKSIIAE